MFVLGQTLHKGASSRLEGGKGALFILVLYVNVSFTESLSDINRITSDESVQLSTEYL